MILICNIDYHFKRFCLKYFLNFTIHLVIVIMAGYNDNEYWSNQNNQQHQTFNFEVPEQFGQEL